MVHALLVGSAGLDNYQGPAGPEEFALTPAAGEGDRNTWPLAEVERSGQNLELTDLPDRFGVLPGGRRRLAAQCSRRCAVPGRGVRMAFWLLD